MKGTLFSADFIKDTSDNMRLLELNTDTAISNSAVNQIDFSSFTSMLETESISELVIIYKLFHENIVTAMENYILNNCSFITTINKHLEERDTIYPTSVVDGSSKFILRMAYDENALLDSEYCKNTVNVLKLFSDNNDLDSIPGFRHGSYEHLTSTINGPTIPDVIVKTTGTTMNQLNRFVKIGKSSNTLEDRFNELKNEYPYDVITNFYDTGVNTCKSFRSLNIVYGNSLDLINLISYESEALFDKPTENLPNDDSVISTEVDVKHYYEYSTNYIRLTEKHGASGLLSEEEVKKSDGTFVPITDIVSGNEVESYSIMGSPSSDVESEFLSWSYSGSSLPEGSSGSTATVMSNAQYDLDYKMVVTITTSNDTIKMSPGTTVLVYQSSTNEIRYKFCYDIDVTDHQLVNIDGGLSPITSVEYEVLNEDVQINILDIEPDDVYFVKNAGGIKFAIHNCFPEGTLINTPNGSVEIQDLKPGDELLSIDDDGNIITSKLGSIRKSTQTKLVVINLDNSKSIKVTPHHPFYRDGEWIKAINLRVGERLKGIESEITITSIQTIEETQTVYNILSVIPNNNYFVEGVLVHNKELVPVSCFAEGTEITMSNNTKKKIEDVLIGDVVMSFDFKTQSFIKCEVIGVDQSHTVGSHSDACAELGNEPGFYTINDLGIKFTPEHPFYTSRGWASLVPNPKDEPYYSEQTSILILEVGDQIVVNGSWVTIETITHIPADPNTTVYNLTVKGSHNYIADNILVHNKL